MTMTQKPWWLNATDEPHYSGELQQAFVDAGVADWSGAGKPHPREMALVAIWFFDRLRDELDESWWDA